MSEIVPAGTAEEVLATRMPSMFEQLLRLRLNSPETHDFPLRLAYKKWSELKQRRYFVHTH